MSHQTKEMRKNINIINDCLKRHWSDLELTDVKWEELQTSRAFIQIDFPVVDLENLTPAERKEVKPYPVLHHANLYVIKCQSNKRMINNVNMRWSTLLGPSEYWHI